MSIGEWIGLIAVAALVLAVGWVWIEKRQADKLPPLEDDDTPDQSTRGGGGPGGVRL